MSVSAVRAASARRRRARRRAAELTCLLAPRHPMEGKTNPIEDVGIRLAAGLHDLHLNENLAPTREAISAAVNQGSESLASAYSFLRSDLSRRQNEWEKRRSVSLAPGTEGEGQAGGGGLEPVGTALLAGVDVAKTGAASLATGIGSFWSSRKGLFAGGAGAGGMKTPPEGGSRSSSPSGASPSSTLSASAAPSSSTSTSPLPSPSFGSFLLRPLSTNPLATTTSNPPPSASTYPPSSTPTTTTPSPSGLASGVGGFFGSIRKSFLEPSPSSTGAAPPSSSAPATGAPKAGLKELELHDPLTVPRDLDLERLQKEERMKARRERELKRAEERLEGRI